MDYKTTQKRSQLTKNIEDWANTETPRDKNLLSNILKEYSEEVKDYTEKEFADSFFAQLTVVDGTCKDCCLFNMCPSSKQILPNNSHGVCRINPFHHKIYFRL